MRGEGHLRGLSIGIVSGVRVLHDDLSGALLVEGDSLVQEICVAIPGDTSISIVAAALLRGVIFIAFLGATLGILRARGLATTTTIAAFRWTCVGCLAGGGSVGTLLPTTVPFVHLF